jgi:signal transduction histidine kinase
MTYGQRIGRVLFAGALMLTLFGPAIQFASGPVEAGTLAALAVGVAAQTTATVLVARRAHAGFAATVLVTVAMLTLDSAWQQLFAVQAVPWVPLVLAWATSRVIDKSTTPAQLWLATALAAAYLAAVAVHAVRSGLAAVPLITAGAALPVLGGACASFAARLSWARIDRMEALAAEREANRQRERTDRNNQLATDLHDTLGHQLTLLVLHANTMAITTHDGDAKGSAAQISRLGNEALADLRRLSDLLAGRGREHRASAVPRAEPGRPQPQPLDFRTTIHEAELAGQRIAIRRTDDLTGVPGPQAAAVQRIVQEGLSNARTHAPGDLVEIQLARTTEDLVLTIRNHPETAEPRTGRPITPRPGGGLGLLGLQGRVELLGGALQAGNDPAGGYCLRATLPLPTAPAPGGPDARS